MERQGHSLEVDLQLGRVLLLLLDLVLLLHTEPGFLLFEALLDISGLVLSLLILVFLLCFKDLLLFSGNRFGLEMLFDPFLAVFVFRKGSHDVVLVVLSKAAGLREELALQLTIGHFELYAPYRNVFIADVNFPLF